MMRKESKEFYLFGAIHSTGQENAKEISMANGTAAVELECTQSTCMG